MSSISVCPGKWVFVTVCKDYGSKGKLIKMRAVKRDKMKPLEEDSSVEVGYWPDAAVPNKGCTKVAVANEGSCEPIPPSARPPAPPAPPRLLTRGCSLQHVGLQPPVLCGCSH